LQKAGIDGRVGARLLVGGVISQKDNPAQKALLLQVGANTWI